MYKIISVGGSIIIPKGGFNIAFLKKFRDLILSEVKKGDKFILVVGGGATCRQYLDAARKVVKLNNDELDSLGVAATKLNAYFVKTIFGDKAYEDVVSDPTKKVKTSKPIIISSGWKPGWSTDYVATLHAKTWGAKEVINLSNIEYVYDKDPRKYKSAQKIEEMVWKDFRKEIVGYKWVAGKNAPFDPIASALAQKLGLTVSILKGTNLTQVKKVLDGGKFKGTVIS